MKLGSPTYEPRRGRNEDQHEVTFTKSFEMMRTPVTQLQWSLVMGKNPSLFTAGGKKVKINGRDIEMHPDRPVEKMPWNDVQEFIQKLNAMDPKYIYWLPTDAEWEYAVRAGTNTPYFFGSDPGELGAYGWHRDNSRNQTHDVASLKPNPNGLYDMLGNVRE